MGKSQPIFSGLVLALLLSACAHAESTDERRQRPDGPPPEALTACEGQSAGSKVTFAGRNGEDIEATCQEYNGKIVAVPNDAPSRRARN